MTVTDVLRNTSSSISETCTKEVEWHLDDRCFEKHIRKDKFTEWHWLKWLSIVKLKGWIFVVRPLKWHMFACFAPWGKLFHLLLHSSAQRWAILLKCQNLMNMYDKRLNEGNQLTCVDHHIWASFSPFSQHQNKSRTLEPDSLCPQLFPKV